MGVSSGFLCICWGLGVPSAVEACPCSLFKAAERGRGVAERD